MKKIIGLIVTMISFIFPAGAQYIDNAKDLIENERYRSAEALLEKNLGAHEPDPELNYLLVKAYLEQDKTNEADSYVNKHLQSALSDNVDPLNRITTARYLLSAGNRQKAEDIFSSVLNNKKNRKNVSLLIAMADIAIEEENGDAKEALTWLEVAAKRDKHNAEIDIARGLAYRKLKDASNAFLSYQSAIQKDPSSVRAHYLMGKIFSDQKNPEVYMDHFLKAYAIDSTYAPVLKELYDHYYYQDVRIAKKYLEKYIANTDHSEQNDYAMTDMLYLNGDYQKAIQSAGQLINSENEKVQPRLYKLMAYSYAKENDSTEALQYMKTYFEKEKAEKTIAPDFKFMAQLTERNGGQEEAAIAYYTIAADMDTIVTNKADYASAIAVLYKKNGDYSNQATWLGKLYQWKEKSGNIDLFNWGIASYMAKDYPLTDSIFSIYTTRYPEDIFGYYWRAQANAAIDTSLSDSLAIPHYYKVIEIGEKNREANKKMLLKAYGYLGGFETNIHKDYRKALEWFEKYHEMDEENEDISKYIEMLQGWIEKK